MTVPYYQDGGTCRGCGRYFACACPRSSLLAWFAAVERERDELRARLAETQAQLAATSAALDKARARHRAAFDEKHIQRRRAEAAEARLDEAGRAT